MTMDDNLETSPQLKRYIKKMSNQVIKTSDPDMTILDLVYDMLTQDEPVSNHELLTSIYILLTNYAYVGVIPPKFIPLAIANYKMCTNRSIRGDIMFFLSNVYYDTHVNRLDLMVNGFVDDCLPMYIADTRYNLNKLLVSPNCQGVQHYLTTELDITVNFMRLYITKHQFCSENASVYSNIFTILSNVAYKDVVYKEFVEFAVEMYLDHVTSAILDYDIIHFLRNVYFDEVGTTYLDEHFILTCVINFITRRADVYPELAAELMGVFARFMKKEELVTKPLIDIALQVLEEYSYTEWAWESIHMFVKDIDDSELLEYMVDRPRTKLLAENTMWHRPEDASNLIRLFCTATTSTETELPCQFFYKYIFEPFQKTGLHVYPRNMLLALSNILTSTDNLEFVDMDSVIKYVVDVLEMYPTSSDLYEDIFFVITNINRVGRLTDLVRNEDFMDHFRTWVSHVDYSHTKAKFVYKSIAHIFRAVSQNESLWYYFDSELGADVRRLADVSDEVRKTVRGSMHCTLQQKCALMLYHQNKIGLDDLKVLDVTIYTST